MIFTVGNLLTLGIVIVILILFRQFDRKSRSLDKLTKHADRLMGELKNFAEQKAEEVHSYGIDLKVEKESGKELMNRLILTNEELAKKADLLANIEDRLQLYGTSLDELKTMTARVQENLIRLQDEAVFVDGVNRRLNEAKSGVEFLERGLEGLVLKFKQENTEAMEKTMTELNASVKSTVSDFAAAAETIERKVEDHREAINKIEKAREASLARDMEIINKTLKTAVEQAGVRADRMEEAALVKLKDQAQERIHRIQASEEEKFKTYQENAKSRVAEIQAMVKSIKEEWRADKQEWEAKEKVLRDENKKQLEELKTNTAKAEFQTASALDSLEKQLDQRIEDFNKKTEKAFNKTSDELVKKSLDGITAKLEEIKNTSAAELKQQETLRDEAAQAQLKAFENWRAKLQEWEEADKLVQNELRNNIDVIKNDVKTIEKESTEVMDRIEKRIEELKTGTEKTIEEQEALIQKTVEKLKAETNQTAAENEALILKKIEELKAITEQTAAENENLIQKTVEKIKTETNQTIAQQEALILKAVEEIRTGTGQTVAEQEELILKTIEEMKTGTEQKVAEHEAFLLKSIEEMKQKALEATETKLDEYRKAQDEEFKRADTLAADFQKLDSELRLSMENTVAKVKNEFAEFEKESSAARKNTAFEFDKTISELKSGFETTEDNLAKLKLSAEEELNEKLDRFETGFSSELSRKTGEFDRRLADWQLKLEKRLSDLTGEAAAERKEMETHILEEMKKSFTVHHDRIILDLENLKTEAGAFEESIRGRMNSAEENTTAYKDQLDFSLEEARKNAEHTIKAEIGNYTLSASSLIKQNQRELEEKIRDISAYVENKNSGLLGLLDATRKTISDLDGKAAAIRTAVDDAFQDADIRRNEILSRTDEQARSLEAGIREAERHIKEFYEQTKLIDEEVRLKIDMERRIEDLRSDIDGLDQRRMETSQMENEFVKIRRLGDEVNAKMARIASEKYRIDKMEADFNRLLQISRGVEDKLAQITASDDVLQETLVQIRKFEEALAGAEDKFLRLEKKDHILEVTTDSIDRDFKAINELEKAIKKADEDISRLVFEKNELQEAVTVLAEQNQKANETAERLSSLDNALAEITEKTKAMQIAREWIARAETRLDELNKQAHNQFKFMEAMMSGKKDAVPIGPGAPSIQKKESVIQLARQGWKKEEIAKNMKISLGEVELILETFYKN